MKFRVLCSGFLCSLAAAFSFGVQAQQTRTAGDRVYSTAQAARGEAVYQKECAICHGATLSGELAPSLAGPEFLGLWGTQPLSDLFDKIHNTMPAQAPGTLTNPQVADVLAYILRANKFPAGTRELGSTEAALKPISMSAVAARAATSAAATPAMSFPAVGNVNQVMRGILFPSSNVLFDVQTQDPDARKAGARPDAASTTGRYGDVYDPWMVVDAAAIAIAEVGPMLMTRGRRCENGKPAPVDRADWQQYVQGIVDAGRAAYKASQSRNQEAVGEVTSLISDACANCHRVYRDTSTNASRCTPPTP